jgi:hypothetical protein
MFRGNNTTDSRPRREQFGFTIHSLTVLFLLIIPTIVGAQSSLSQINVEPAAGLPNGFVTEVDILFVYDANLLNQLPFTQFDWVSSKELYLDREDNLLDIITLTVKPDSSVVPINLPARSNDAIGILVFASHEDPVAEALDISFESNIVLQIESYGINVLQR